MQCRSNDRQGTLSVVEDVVESARVDRTLRRHHEFESVELVDVSSTGRFNLATEWTRRTNGDGRRRTRRGSGNGSVDSRGQKTAFDSRVLKCLRNAIDGRAKACSLCVISIPFLRAAPERKSKLPTLHARASEFIVIDHSLASNRPRSGWRHHRRGQVTLSRTSRVTTARSS